MKRVELLITLIVLVLTASYGAQTDSLFCKESVAESGSLPIDGLYEKTSSVERAMKKAFGVLDVNKIKVRFDKGRAYYVSDGLGIWGNDPNYKPGKIVIDHIILINQYKYKGVLHTDGVGWEGKTFNVVIRVEGSSLFVPYPSKLGFSTDVEFVPIE